MTDAPAWPGEPGFPPEPTDYGKYWLKRNGLYFVVDWLPDPFYPDNRNPGWKILKEILTPEKVVAREWTFGGQLLTPPEIAQLEREAELRGWKQAIVFFQELDVPAEYNPHTNEFVFVDEICRQHLKAFLAELAKRSAEAAT